MPQLDVFALFNVLILFLVFFVGLLLFSIYIVPRSILYGKLRGSRTFYYYVSIISMLSGNVNVVVHTYYLVFSKLLIVYMHCALTVSNSSMTYKVIKV
jgi:hypothetical protein